MDRQIFSAVRRAPHRRARRQTERRRRRAASVWRTAHPRLRRPSSLFQSFVSSLSSVSNPSTSEERGRVSSLLQILVFLFQPRKRLAYTDSLLSMFGPKKQLKRRGLANVEMHTLERRIQSPKKRPRKEKSSTQKEWLKQQDVLLYFAFFPQYTIFLSCTVHTPLAECMLHAGVFRCL